MRYRAAVLALAFLCAPLLSNLSFARQSETEIASYYNYAVHAPVIINQNGPQLENLQNHIEEIDQSDANSSWKSIRTFDLNRPIKVYVDTNPRDKRLYKPAFGKYVSEGLQAWSNALDGRLRYEFTPDPAEAEIRVFWTPRFSNPDQAGVTDFTIGEANIKIQTIGYPDNIIRGNIMHELGHALGIGEHSASNNDIMVACRNWSSYEAYEHYTAHLSQYDKQAIRRLYGRQWNKGEDLYQAIARLGRVKVDTNHALPN